MSRKPAHLMMAGKRPRGRQAVWEAIRQLRRFTLTQLAQDIDHDRGAVRTYVDSLVRGGYLALAGHEPAPSNIIGLPANPHNLAKVFELVQDVGVEAPRIRRDGTPCTQGASREQMWRTMKLLSDFSPRELAITASTETHRVAEADAKDYVKRLHAAGYLSLVAAASPVRQARYRFMKARNSGPLAPQVQRLKSVWDPNLCKIMWQEEPGE